MRFIYLFYFLFFFSFIEVTGQIKMETYENDEFLDSFDTTTVEVKEYVKYTPGLNGTEKRLIENIPVSGLVKDYYPNGKIKHKGYYTDGQLTNYTNYFSNGKVERTYKARGVSGYSYQLYYSNGNKRLLIEYRKRAIIEYVEYYPSGQIASHEKFHKKGKLYEFYKLYYPDGTLKLELLPVDKKLNMCTVKIYWPSGILKQQGTKVFNDIEETYVKQQSWHYYNEKGKILLTEEYTHGRKIK